MGLYFWKDLANNRPGEPRGNGQMNKWLFVCSGELLRSVKGDTTRGWHPRWPPSVCWEQERGSEMLCTHTHTQKTVALFSFHKVLFTLASYIHLFFEWIRRKSFSFFVCVRVLFTTIRGWEPLLLLVLAGRYKSVSETGGQRKSGVHFTVASSPSRKAKENKNKIQQKNTEKVTQVRRGSTERSSGLWKIVFIYQSLVIVSCLRAICNYRTIAPSVQLDFL